MKILLIDTSYLTYRSYFAYPNLTHNNTPVGALYGFIKTVLYLCKTHTPDEIVFACDSKIPSWRHSAYPAYKQGRPPMEDKLKTQLPVIREWIELFTPHVFENGGYEADDILYSLAADYGVDTATHDDPVEENKNLEFSITVNELHKQSAHPKNEVLVFSSDKDLYQLLLHDSITILKSGKHGVVEWKGKDIIDTHGIHPIQWLDYKVLVGDSSDNLPGIAGIGPKTASTILQAIGSLWNICDHEGIEHWFLPTHPYHSETYTESLEQWKEKKKKQYDAILSNLPTLQTMYELVQLKQVPGVTLSKKWNPIQGYSHSIPFVQKYGFTSLESLIHSELGEVDMNTLFA